MLGLGLGLVIGLVERLHVNSICKYLHFSPGKGKFSLGMPQIFNSVYHWSSQCFHIMVKVLILFFLAVWYI